MTKKILFICNYFAPDNTIAAVRTSKLAKYLQQNGYEVEVITEKKNAELEDEILKNLLCDKIKILFKIFGLL